MHIPRAYIDHPEVTAIQPTWHCLKRFRERVGAEPGVNEVITALTEALSLAEITTQIPKGIRSSREPFALWAVYQSFAFPLVEDGYGVWVAPTCLAATPRAKSTRSS
jgi:hypothetical protein